MDWLEEKWEAAKRYLRDASLLRSLWGYGLLTIITIFVCNQFTRSISLSWIRVLQTVGEGGGFYQNGGFLYADSGAGWGMRLLLFCYNYSIYVYLVLGLLAMSRLFVEKKIRQAAEAMSESLHAMAIGDLSYEISYHSQDEMGQLCMECEALRKTLVRDKQSQWDDQEEQRKINSAFAHDVRTPLTVIKGYTEFLMKYVPGGRVTEEMLLERLETMLYQENRLLEFSRTMSTIQEVEQRELHLSWQTYDRVLNQVEILAVCMEEGNAVPSESGRTAKKGLKIQVIWEGDRSSQVFLDLSALMEAFENILNNSLEAAETAVTVKLQLEEQWLYLYVADDGPGFSQRALREADQFYYSEAKEKAHHFGMGLSISKMLCEKHGGCLRLQNGIGGGAIVAMEIKCL